MTRGYRNNNPGNLIKTSTVWVGQTLPGDDAQFMTFDTMEYGYRAVFVLLNGYINKGYDTINTIIARYAPSSENNTSAYINHVVQLTGIAADTVLDFSNSQDMIKLVAAISTVENGITPDWTQITAGYELLSGQITTVKTVGISLVALTLVSALGYIAFYILKK